MVPPPPPPPPADGCPSLPIEPAFSGHAPESGVVPLGPEVVKAMPGSTRPVAADKAWGIPRGPAKQKGMSAARVAARATASKLMAVSASSTCGAPAVARSLGISAQAVQNLLDPAHKAALTLGDLLAIAAAGEVVFATTVLAAALGVVQQHSREPLSSRATLVEQALGLGCALGHLQEDVRDAIADGKIDRDEASLIVRDAREIERAAQMLQASAAAAAAGASGR